MGDFDDGVELGLWGDDGMPYWMDDKTEQVRPNYPDVDSTIKFETMGISSMSHIVRIYIGLTPQKFLTDNQKNVRRKLEQKSSAMLSIKVNKDNEYDNNALEVYYDTTFIGYVKKNYGSYDYSKRIDDYCFFDNEYDNIEIMRVHDAYILVKSIDAISNKMLKDLSQDDVWIKKIWKWAIMNYIHTIPLEKKKLLALTCLNASSKNIKNIPAEVFQLENLESIFLDKNSLTEIPKEIGNLTNLDTLCLNNNALSSLPASISKLKKLQSLDLEYNSFKIFPKYICNLKLKELYLSDNELMELPSEIGKLSALKKLYLSDNELMELPKEIGNLTQLKRLDLGDNRLKKLPSSIGNLINLEELFLQSNQLTELPESMINLKKFTLSPYIHDNVNELIMPGKRKIGKWEPAIIFLGFLFFILWVASFN